MNDREASEKRMFDHFLTNYHPYSIKSKENWELTWELRLAKLDLNWLPIRMQNASANEREQKRIHLEKRITRIEKEILCRKLNVQKLKIIDTSTQRNEK